MKSKIVVAGLYGLMPGSLYRNAFSELLNTEKRTRVRYAVKVPRYNENSPEHIVLLEKQKEKIARRFERYGKNMKQI